MAKSVVSITKGDDPEKMVAEAVALLGGVESMFKPGATVVLKPNAGHAYPAGSSVNTSPAVVAAVIKEMRKGKPKQIIVAEASATGADSLECLEVSGIRAAAEEAGVDRIIDIKRETDLVEFQIPDARSDIKSVKLPRFLLEADYKVNLPIFKSHVSMVFSCALKNIKGIVQDRHHVAMHQTDLAASMMDLWSITGLDLTIADLIHPMEGFGPHCGTPMDFGCIVAGKDPVAVDSTVCRMVGLDVAKVDYFRAALERGVGNIEEKDIEIRGKQIKDVFKQMWLPYMGGFGAWPEFDVYADNSCSSCQSLAAFTLVKLQGLGEYEKNVGTKLLLGKKRELPEGVEPGDNVVLMGDCLRGLKYKIEKAGGKCIYVEGCPPLEPLPLFAIIDHESQPNAEYRESTTAFRDRLERDNHIFLDWLKTQAEMKRKERE